MKKIIENRIHDALMLTKKAYKINGLVCVERAGYKKVNEKNILKIIDFIKSINKIDSLSINFNNIMLVKSTSLLRLDIDGRIFVATSRGADNRFVIDEIALNNIE